MSETADPPPAASQPPPPPPQRQPDPPRYQDPPPQQESQHRRTPTDQVADLRAEAAQYRISLRRTEQERDDLQQRMADLQAQIESAKTAAVAPLQQRLAKASERAVTLAIQAEMMALGLQDADLIHLYSKMPDPPKVEVSDEFEVTGARELAKKFKEWKPDYFKPAAPADDKRPPPPRRAAPPKTGEGDPPPSQEGAASVDARKMDKKTYDAFKANWLRDLRRADMR